MNYKIHVLEKGKKKALIKLQQTKNYYKLDLTIVKLIPTTK